MGTHIINRQVIDLKVNSEKNAFSIQQRVREIYFEEVVPLLNEVMNGMTAEDEILYLDRLEIDLGILNFDHLHKEMMESLRHKISSQLKEQLRGSTASFPEAISSAGKSMAVRKTGKQSKLDLLRVFFLTGNLPWWADDEQAPPDIDLLIRELLEKDPAGLFSVLRVVASEQAGAQRVFFQTGEKVKQQILAALPGNTQKNILRVIDGLAQVVRSRNFFSLTTSEINRLVFITAISVAHEIHSASGDDADEIIIRVLIREIPPVTFLSPDYVQQKMYREVLTFLISQQQAENFRLPVIRHFKKWESANPGLAEEVTGDKRLTIAALAEGNRSRAARGIMDEAITRFSERQLPGELPEMREQKKNNGSEISKATRVVDGSGPDLHHEIPGTDSGDDLSLFHLPEEIRALIEPPEKYIAGDENPALARTRYAGLVLLAPFLPAFFEEMKLLETGVFRGEKEKFKAIHLLNFMATNKIKAPEYSLVLHKILCGMEITDPVPKGIKLNAEEKRATSLFLDDIAEQWTTLRGTSGDAFRETFMKRNGIIDQRENAWLLRIERAPMDVLLDTLPWNISIIKLPWMQQLLHVEW